MKRNFFLMITCLVFCLTKAQAQYTILTIEQVYGSVGRQVHICANKYDRALVYAPQGCTGFQWDTGDEFIYDVSPMVFDGNAANYYSCGFYGCGYDFFLFGIYFEETNVPAESTEELMKRQHETVELYVGDLPPISQFNVWNYYRFLWSTGETTSTIQVVEPGIYMCDISDFCATTTKTFIVKDNVEIHRATVDLETNLNKVTWQVTPEQARYISEVKVERDGFVVGTAPYEQGYFTDNIGSENAARNYRLTGITTGGTECPIPSYQKGTLHVDYSPNASNPNKLNMAWTPPFIEEGAPVSVTYFQICKYDPTTGEVTVIDQLGANNTIASYNRDLFEGGYAVIGVVFNDGRADEEVSFSNRSEDIIMAIGEQQSEDFRIYPNPAQGRVTIEGTGRLTITNVLGQTILTRDITDTETLELPRGVWFVKLNGATRKLVVE